MKSLTDETAAIEKCGNSTLKVLQSHSYVLTIVAASIFHNLALLLFCGGFEDSGSVVLQLLNALLDVVQGSERGNQFNRSRRCLNLKRELKGSFCLNTEIWEHDLNH